ncbi:MAG: Tryptophan-tRNA ligase, bacterial-type [Labilithrix sp.]|nr:Tryptophan-tRNA ligase, bacterial-type [Labilithrix sp.]
MSQQSPFATTMEIPPAAAKPARVFSGIQPTGELHIGNYLGAVRTWRQQIEEGKDETMFCVVDAHAITVPYDPKDLRKNIDDLCLDLIACGLDPEKTTLFVQSDVREHTELAWYLASVTPMGDLGRMTQFKDKGEGKDFVSTGLFTYPVLMSADILLYKATVVPVGEDQVQHLELARETVRRFNHRFPGEKVSGKKPRPIFVEPKPRLSVTPRIMGLDGESKMSKSKGNTIGLFEHPDSFWKKLSKAYTDPQRLKLTDPGRPEICNIFTMHKAISPKETQDEVVANCTGAKWGCVACKKVLFDNFEKELIPLRTKREALSIEQVRQAMGDGAAKARRIAVETMKEVRQVMGLGSLAT